MKHLLITGAAGVGKSTLLRRVVSMSPKPLAGFVTHEVCEDNEDGQQRVGFETEIIGGHTYLIAHKYALPKYLPKFGSLYVDVRVVRDILCPLINKAIDTNELLVIDEIGRFLLLAGEIAESAVIRALDRTVSTIATVQLREHPFTDVIKHRSDVEVWYVTIPNRNKLRGELLDFIRTGNVEKSRYSAILGPIPSGPWTTMK